VQDLSPSGTAYVDPEIVLNPDLPTYVKLVYTGLATRCDPTGRVCIAVDDVALTCGISTRTARRALKQAVALGIVNVTRGPDLAHPNAYHLQDFQASHNPRRMFGTAPPPRPARRLNIAKAQRLSHLVARAGWACSYCGAPLVNTITGEHEADPRYRRPVIDHVVPRSRGGSNRLDNLALSCDPCNLVKSDRLLDELPLGWSTL